MVIKIRSFPNLSLISSFITRETRRVLLVVRERTAYPSVAPKFTPPSVLCGGFSCSIIGFLCFVDYCPFSFGHCIVWPSIDGFWLPPWYHLQTSCYHQARDMDTSLTLVYLCYCIFFCGNVCQKTHAAVIDFTEPSKNTNSISSIHGWLL